MQNASVNKSAKHKTLNMKNSPPAIKLASNSVSVSLEAQVRARAYELFEARGSRDGHAFEDWLLAEKQIARAKGQATSA